VRSPHSRRQRTVSGYPLAQSGKTEEANLHINELVRLATGDAVAQSYLCFVLRQMGHLDEAIIHCSESLRLDADLLYSRFNLAAALTAQGKTTEAIGEISRVLAVNPDYAEASVKAMTPTAARVSPRWLQ
jgi:tetratricopeptide (TPR) repeat protein